MVKIGEVTYFLVDYGIEQSDEGGVKYVLLHAGDTMDPDELKFPKATYERVDPAPIIAKGGGFLLKGGQAMWME